MCLCNFHIDTCSIVSPILQQMGVAYELRGQPREAEFYYATGLSLARSHAVPSGMVAYSSAYLILFSLGFHHFPVDVSMCTNVFPSFVCRLRRPSYNPLHGFAPCAAVKDFLFHLSELERKRCRYAKSHEYASEVWLRIRVVNLGWLSFGKATLSHLCVLMHSYACT